jgi:hypothetical protein
MKTNDDENDFANEESSKEGEIHKIWKQHKVLIFKFKKMILQRKMKIFKIVDFPTKIAKNFDFFWF